MAIAVFLKSVALPWIVLGGVSYLITMLYSGMLISSFNPAKSVEGALAKLLSYFKLDTTTGVGKVIVTIVNFLIGGFLVVLGIAGVQLLGLSVPPVSSIRTAVSA